MKRVIPLLLVLAIGGAVVYFHPQWFRKPAVENVLKLSGNIEAHESLVSFKVTGRIAALPVDEGMTIQCGDLLARLDNDDYRQQVAAFDGHALIHRQGDDAACHFEADEAFVGLDVA